MDCKLILNIVGLSSNIVGALLIWKYGLPANINREGHSYRILENEDVNEKTLARKYDLFSMIGMILLILGFIFQLIALFFN